MDETSVRGLLEIALGDEPPIGPVARNSLLAGIRLRRRARIRRATGGAAAVVVVAAVIPAATGAFGNGSAGQRTEARFSVPRVPSVPTGTAYVINSGGGTVTPIDLATNTAGKPIDVPGEPVALTAAPDGKTGYIINGFPSRTVTRIDLATNKLGKPITLIDPPYGIVMAPDGKLAYVTIARGVGIKESLYYFAPFDLATGRLGKWIKLSSGDPASIAIARDGKTAYVVSQSSSRMIAVTPIDLTTLKPEKPISIRTKAGPTKGYYGQPLAIAIARDGKTAYVADGALSMVTPIDLANGTHGKPISLSGKVGSDAIAISSNGAAAYVANQPSSTVTPINLRTDKPEKPLKIGSGWDSGFEAIVTVP
jgi:DNA-binding beta-propeller fold protein YncE